VLVLAAKSLRPEFTSRLLFALAYSGTGILLFGMMQLVFPEQIVLRDESASYTSLNLTTTVPRVGLHIMVARPRFMPFVLHRKGSWAFSSEDVLGPIVDGWFVYWGPGGLIQGNEVGKRLVDWVETAPRRTVRFDRGPTR
jgi:hypothetical protein